MSHSAILLDRDGVLNENRTDHVKSPEEFKLLPGVLAAMRVLADTKLPIVVLTNQAIINRGTVTQQTVDSIHHHMNSLIARAGGRIDRILSCPHSPEEKCACRKPEPGMLFEAATELNLDLSRSVFVGDALTDVQAGHRVGCRTVLVRSGRGAEALASLSQTVGRWPDMVADDLFSALPGIIDLLGLAESRETALTIGQQERRHEEISGLQVAAHISDAAYDS